MTEKKKLTYENAVGLLTEIVSERPDHVFVATEKDYNVCFYSDTAGNPSCVMGHFLSRLGVQLPIKDYEGWDITFVLESLGYELESQTSLLLTTTQQEQDTAGVSWGSALQRGLRSVATLSK